MAMPASLSLLLSLTFLTSTPAANGGPEMPELWCVAKSNANSSALESALDWACGPGCANCGPIQQGGPCYNASDVFTTASYAFNDYFLKHGLTIGSCNFGGTATLTYLNPSYGSCIFPSSFTVKNGTFTGPSMSTAGIYTVNPDLSGASCFSCTWYWPLITIHFFLAITLFPGGQ